MSPSLTGTSRRVFFSSALRQARVPEIRTNLKARLEASGYTTFFFEHEPAAGWSTVIPATNERICLDEVDRADIVIAIFHTSYGSSGPNYHHAGVSFTDLEFFEAFRRRKKVLVYLLEPFTPEPLLAQLVQIIRSVAPGSVVSCKTQQALEDRVERDIDSHFGVARTARLSSTPSRFAAYCRAVLLTRQVLDDEFTGLRFLLDRYPSATATLDRDSIVDQLRLADSALNHSETLTLTWNAILSLEAAPWRTESVARDLWDRAFSRWTKSAAWSNLHGLLPVGALAGNNTLVAIRALVASEGESASLLALIRKNATKTGSVNGWVRLFSMGMALASEYFSIARMAPRRLASRYLERAETWCDIHGRALAIQPDQNTAAELSSMRGEIRWARGDLKGAIELMERALQERIDVGNRGNIAWGKAVLGFAQFQAGRRSQGSHLLREGTAELEISGSPEFVVRAKKRLVYVCLRQRLFTEAFDQIESARKLCHLKGLHGQLEDLERLDRQIVRKIGRLLIALRLGR